MFLVIFKENPQISSCIFDEMAYYTVRYSYTTVRTRLEFSETDLRTVSGYDQFAVNPSQVEFLLTVRTNILVKHHPAG